ncbi:hypothetical protein BKA70DRAFT_1400772 [Coprinopsis sp. MPI-PUGE-AT-0042]|nr:hypothetical protein BKA70DRAFT_1400772 [Coprinopsis sp. MPI-PUGE-AT-0042]
MSTELPSHAIQEKFLQDVYGTRSALSRRAALETIDRLLEVSRSTPEVDTYRHALESALKLCEGPLCPVHRLPDDVLREIFIHYCEQLCVPLSVSPLKSSILSEEDPPCVLDYICSRLVRVSRSTVQLWKSIPYDFCDANPDKVTGSITWVQAIGVIPPVLASLKVLDLLHCRSENMEIAADTSHRIQPLDVLDVESLSLCNIVFPVDPPSHNYDFLSAPRVSYMDLSEYRHGRILLPSLAVYNLDKMSRLCDLDVPDSDTFASPLPELAFPQLQSLYIQTHSGNQGHGIPWILQILNCPRLNGLAVCPSDGEKGVGQVKAALPDFLSRSGRQIDELTFANFSPAEVAGLLNIDALKRISQLDVRLSRVTPARAGTYQLYWLWIRVDGHRETTGPVTPTPFSLTALTDLCNAGIWKRASNGDAAWVRLEFRFPFTEDLKAQLLQESDIRSLGVLWRPANILGTSIDR